MADPSKLDDAIETSVPILPRMHAGVGPYNSFDIGGVYTFRQLDMELRKTENGDPNEVRGRVLTTLGRELREDPQQLAAKLTIFFEWSVHFLRLEESRDDLMRQHKGNIELLPIREYDYVIDGVRVPISTRIQRMDMTMYRQVMRNGVQRQVLGHLHFMWAQSQDIPLIDESVRSNADWDGHVATCRDIWKLIVDNYEKGTAFRNNMAIEDRPLKLLPYEFTAAQKILSPLVGRSEKRRLVEQLVDQNCADFRTSWSNYDEGPNAVGVHRGHWAPFSRYFERMPVIVLHDYLNNDIQNWQEHMQNRIAYDEN